MYGDLYPADSVFLEGETAGEKNSGAACKRVGRPIHAEGVYPLYWNSGSSGAGAARACKTMSSALTATPMESAGCCAKLTIRPWGSASQRGPLQPGEFVFRGVSALRQGGPVPAADRHGSVEPDAGYDGDGNRRRVLCRVHPENREALEFFRAAGFVPLEEEPPEEPEKIWLVYQLRPWEPDASKPTKPYLVEAADYEAARERAADLVDSDRYLTERPAVGLPPVFCVRKKKNL